ncbi:OpgC domain-containing protein [uncultured Kocuria sp.]|uniref:OpgC domain-containing protein n=1 Tax=uncultured Kocuria sp. TaxID=259305 RepID=UPI00261C89BE|nr:OpgC domain-containing protein [uncultured Kocuria sp.]
MTPPLRAPDAARGPTLEGTLVPIARRRVRPRAAAALILLLLVLLAAPAGPVRAAEEQEPDGPYLGALLDWGADTAADHAERLGTPAAVYGRPVPLPMSEQERGHLRDYFSQVSGQGAHALLTIRPEIALGRVDEAQASVLAGQLADAAEGFGGTVFVRFAPQMNAAWVPWGQQPRAYTEAFRAVAAALDAELGNPVMVWSPTAGTDYPFRAPSGTPPPGGELALLDTTGDGVWDQDDDPYGPYYPGDDAVDWAGLVAYHDETGNGPARNVLPAPGKFSAMLGSGEAAGPSGEDDFYAEYAVGRGKPLMVETGAFYSPGAGGPSEPDIKGAWWDQVLAATSAGDHDRVRAVVWNETIEQRDDGAVTVDWRITAGAGTVTAAGDRLRDSALVTGPVTERSEPPGADPPATGSVLEGPAAWGGALAVLAVALFLWVLPLRGPARAWAYADPSRRDLRIDMLRGAAIVFVVVNHVGIASVFQLLTQETVGVVSGAELFVLLSGAVLGMVHGPRAKDDLGVVVDRTISRAWKLYVTALVVVLAVYGLSLLPFLDAGAVTTFTDQGTGAAGAGAAGTTYDLYSGMEGLLQFPVPAHLIPSLLLLQIGPWQFNIMGLYVILLLVSPLVLAALARGRAWLVLAVSLALYTAGTVFRIRLLPSQFEDSFPLLVWQVLFVVGMTAGHHRRQIVDWFSHRRRRPVLGACLALAVVFALFAWSSPYLTNAYDVRLALLPESTFRTVYDAFFGRTYLGVGRLVNVLLVVVAGYAALSAYWRPLERAIGWFLVPLGQATLYVFVMHVFLILAVANVPALQQGNLWGNTAAYVVVLGLLWVMVRTGFLFRIVPR